MLLFVIGSSCNRPGCWVIASRRLRHRHPAGVADHGWPRRVLVRLTGRRGSRRDHRLRPVLSSTALILQVLAERGELTTRHGRSAFAILLFQDLAHHAGPAGAACC
jgi:hypothetical protein